MIRKRNDLKVKNILKRNGLKVAGNSSRADMYNSIVVTQYNSNAVIVVLNNVITIKEAMRVLDGLLKDIHVIFYE